MNLTIMDHIVVGNHRMAVLCGFLALMILAKQSSAADDEAKLPRWVPLFASEGVPSGWSVRQWDELAKAADAETKWIVKDGVLLGSEPRGTWLISDREYGDFELEYEFRLGERGNSGLAIRSPLYGDPAFDGIELQMADLRYNTSAKDSELTGGLYRALAPSKQVYKPTEWNHMHVRIKGSALKVVLNEVVIHDLDLHEHDQEVRRHDGTMASALKDRPMKGHIGFQELSRDDGRVQIRHVRIREFVSN